MSSRNDTDDGFDNTIVNVPAAYGYGSPMALDDENKTQQFVSRLPWCVILSYVLLTILIIILWGIWVDYWFNAEVLCYWEHAEPVKVE